MIHSLNLQIKGEFESLSIHGMRVESKFMCHIKSDITVVNFFINFIIFW